MQWMYESKYTFPVKGVPVIVIHSNLVNYIMFCILSYVVDESGDNSMSIWIVYYAIWCDDID